MWTRFISWQTKFDLSNALEKYNFKASSHCRYARTPAAPNLASAAQDFAKITSLDGATQNVLKQTSHNFKNYESISLSLCGLSGPTNLPWGMSLRL
jgi:hypothetical protein